MFSVRMMVPADFDEVAELIFLSTNGYYEKHLGHSIFQCLPDDCRVFPEVYEDLQIRHREMEISMDHPLTGDSKMKMIGNPIRYSETPVSYRNPPPMLGQHNREILKDWLQLEDVEIERLSQNEVL